MQFITELLNHYGYIVLLVSLMIELIAFPVPGEALMTYCGFLVFEGKLNWSISILMATVGVILGITISYLIGFTLGFSFFYKYGSYIHLGPKRLEKTSKWFKRYGNKLLIIAYFIPGLRHITGYFSGITKIHYKKFALRAYIGAFIWTGTFISLGKILGPDWEKFHSFIRKYLIIGSLFIAVVMIIVYLYKSYKLQITEFVISLLNSVIVIFHSLGKVKVAITSVAVVFLGLSVLVIGIIQDFLSNEFIQFDSIVAFLIRFIFTEKWSYIMRLLGLMTSIKVLILLITLVFIWIIIKGVDKLLEIRFLLITIIGGEFLEEVLRLIFHRLGPLGLSLPEKIKYTFPSEQSLVAVVAYGFAAFLIVRHTKKVWLKTIAIIISLAVCFFTGVSVLFFQVQFPSDVVAGYVFGGVWLSLNIVLLEIFRILPKVQL
ncbi:membrane-associated protein [Caloranaerobacter sp. TR13]|uniref:VTT domain-containing protein n=1 Tax=Caloranaerobacter sp. TR13 TaxID=1302151 RepID=UPI0006D44C37|nr:VTT domain-containing protein [Caloranaerobacter sp. TR13]KPU27280.1 membrane-associated protein [Caloranaerobacter sp. TR13]